MKIISMITALVISMATIAAVAASFASPAVPGWIAPAAAGCWACTMMAWATISGLCPEGGRDGRSF